MLGTHPIVGARVRFAGSDNLLNYAAYDDVLIVVVISVKLAGATFNQIWWKLWVAWVL